MTDVLLPPAPPATEPVQTVLEQFRTLRTERAEAKAKALADARRDYARLLFADSAEPGDGARLLECIDILEGAGIRVDVDGDANAAFQIRKMQREVEAIQKANEPHNAAIATARAEYLEIKGSKTAREWEKTSALEKLDRLGQDAQPLAIRAREIQSRISTLLLDRPRLKGA